jgi:hypothetical protein
MSSMLRLYRGSGRRGAALLGKESNGGKQAAAAAPISRLMGTQSGDDAKPPTALARLHLEDGSTLTGRSFGSHESISGEVGSVVVHFAATRLLLRHLPHSYTALSFRLYSFTMR